VDRQDENLISITQLVPILDISRKTIVAWVLDGTLPEPLVKRGKKRFWFWWQIKAFVAKPSSPIRGNSGESAS